MISRYCKWLEELGKNQRKSEAMDPPAESTCYDAATRFFIGIPVWIGIAFLLDAIGQGMEGIRLAVCSGS